VLGDGTPLLSADRSGTSIGVVVRGIIYVFDAGPGVLRRLLEAQQRLGLGIVTLGPVFVTHLHSDHTLGLPELLYPPGVPSLRGYGPPGIQKMLNSILDAWSEDRQVRSHSTMARDNALARQAGGATATEVTSGMVFRDSNVTVTAFRVAHGDWPTALGYRVEVPGRSIVISGDTRPTQAIVDACNGCDLLIHAVYNGETPLPAGGSTYFRRFHTSAIELGDIARRARPRVLLLYHQLLFDGSRADLIRQVATTFRGPVISARDLDVY
jgi:ribonuclease BN (tRNA processing enzyme)